MKININDIRIFASGFLKVLEEQEVKSAADLEKLLGKQLKVEHQEQDFVAFDNRPSNLSTMAYTLSYIQQEAGIPIELKINGVLNYSQVIIKSQKPLAGYSPFSVDSFENIIQNKVLKSSDISLSRNELIALSELKE